MTVTIQLLFNSDGSFALDGKSPDPVVLSFKIFKNGTLFHSRSRRFIAAYKQALL